MREETGRDKGETERRKKGRKEKESVGFSLTFSKSWTEMSLSPHITSIFEQMFSTHHLCDLLTVETPAHTLMQQHTHTHTFKFPHTLSHLHTHHHQQINRCKYDTHTYLVTHTHTHTTLVGKFSRLSIPTHVSLPSVSICPVSDQPSPPITRPEPTLSQPIAA